MSQAPPIPYLTLNIPQALSLPEPQTPERRTYTSIIDLLDHRSRHGYRDSVAAGFAEPEQDDERQWTCSALTYRQLPPLARSLAKELLPEMEQAERRIPAVDPSLPPLSPTPVVAILCPSGLEFFVHALAIWYAGYALLPIAIGTTKEGVQNLMDKTGACVLLVHTSQKELAEKTVELYPRDKRPAVIDVRSRERVLSLLTIQEGEASQAGQSSRQLDANSVLIIFHSSGSTGLPKPIYHIHRFWAFSTTTASGTQEAAYTTTPLYHGGMSDFLRSLQAGSSIFFHPIIGSTLSVEAILAGHRACAAVAGSRAIKYFLSVPFILAMLSKEQTGIDYLASMNLVSTGGAPLPEPVGDLLVSKQVPLVSRLGSSECGFLMSSHRDFGNDQQWSWLRIEDPLTEQLLDFKEDSDNPGLAELIVTAKWPTKLLSNAARGAFSTEDLYSRHPDHPNWYRYATRVDDTLVLLNGKKFAAGLIESRLKQSDLLDDAIVFGSNRALVGALLLPTPQACSLDASAEERYQMVQRLQPHLDEINTTLPSHAKLSMELLCIPDAATAQAIPRSSKGTLQRGHAYRQLSSLFDQIYDRFEQGRLEGYPIKKSVQGEELISLLQKMIGRILNRKDQDAPFGKDLDFYKAGMDSIASVRIKAAIHQHVDLGHDPNGESRQLNGRAIYDHPTVEEMARYIESLRSGGTNGVNVASSTEAEMKEMATRYARSLPAYQPRSPSDDRARSRVVVLTGATGALGAHLLTTLLAQKEPRIDAVVCLVRASSNAKAQQRVRESLQARKLADQVMPLSTGRLSCFAADLSAGVDLGIDPSFEVATDSTTSNGSPAGFWQLLQSATDLSVLHAAWSVNFVLSLKSFEADNIKGLRNLLAFALEQGASSFLFCSSVATVLGGEAREVKKEVISQDPATAGTIGYSQSKWVAESLLSQAATDVASPSSDKGNMTISVARIGQLCSDTAHGVWNESEAWPLLIRTAKEVGRLPRIQQPIDWLPVDQAAEVLVELASIRKGLDTEDVNVYHVVLPVDQLGPQAIPGWDDLLTWLEQTDGTPDFQKVSHDQWLSALEQKGSSHVRGWTLVDGIWKNLKPVESREEEDGGTVIDTSRARGNSETLRDHVSPLNKDVLQRTVKVWKERGFL